MVSLEQVRLLDTKVSRAIDYVKKVTEENTRLEGKLNAYQKRIDELEVLIQQFKEEQSRIEDGILSALDRLNQFEDAVESKLSNESKLSGESKLPVRAAGEATAKAAQKKDGRKDKEAAGPAEKPEPQIEPEPSAGRTTAEELDIF